MTTKTEQDLLYCIYCSLHSIVPDENLVATMDLSKLYRLARRHTVPALVFYALEKEAPWQKMEQNQSLVKQWRESRDQAVRKNILLDVERTQLFSYLENKKIWYMPLKGSILKDSYPQAGMRQMADNDILFDANGQEKVKEWFVLHGYEVESYGEGNHDCYMKKPVYNFEMHTALFGEVHEKAWQEYYKDVKGRLLKKDGKNYEYQFSAEDFYIYMMCHAIKHFQAGGTGIRTLVDTYVFLSEKEPEMDWEYIRREEEKLGIDVIEKKIRDLSKKLFQTREQELSADEEKMLAYFFGSGTYGTRENSIQNKMRQINQKEKRPSIFTKGKYIFLRMFPDERTMDSWTKARCKRFYKKRWSYPLMRCYRIIRILGDRSGKKRLKEEIKIVRKN